MDYKTTTKQTLNFEIDYDNVKEKLEEAGLWALINGIMRELKKLKSSTHTEEILPNGNYNDISNEEFFKDDLSYLEQINEYVSGVSDEYKLIEYSLDTNYTYKIEVIDFIG